MNKESKKLQKAIINHQKHMESGVPSVAQSYKQFQKNWEQYSKQILKPTKDKKSSILANNI